MKFVERLLLEIIRLPLITLWRLQGWQLSGAPLPNWDKMILLAVPHTSFWDYYHMLMAALVLRRKPHTTTKHTLFWFPLSLFLYATGCIPINREQALNMVDTLAELIAREKRFVLVFTPEGTRKKTKYWKSGFYHTAVKANMPIICGAIDYKNKRLRLAEPIHPTGDIDADFEQIKTFYEQYGRNGKNLEWMSDIALKPRKYESARLAEGTQGETVHEANEF
jgi:1-acyl-sn-glycerol-3-phosphate acyltransferase